MSVRVRCNCGYRMELPDDWAGKQGRCPQCHMVLAIPAARPSPKPSHAPVKAEVKSEPATEPGETTNETAPLTTHHSPLTNRLRNPIWLSAIAGGACLLLLGAYLLIRGGGAGKVEKQDTVVVGSSTESTPGDTKSADVFRPASEKPDAGIESLPEAPAPIETSPKVQASNPRRPALIGPGAGGQSLESWSLRDHGVEIPVGASVIEIDGVALPLKDPAALAARGGISLALPLGKHIVRFGRTGPPRVVEPRRWFLDAYREAAARIQENGRWSFDRLLDASQRSLDRFTEPFVPHFWGNFYWQEGQRDAAARNYAWALEIAPTFAPSYLNLAQLAHEHGDDDDARRFLRLAELWNAQNAYGIALASSNLRASLDVEQIADSDDEPEWFVRQHDALTARDRDMVAVLTSAAEFATRLTDRAKILNNLGAYFEHVGNSGLALEHYRSAAAALGTAKLDPEERRIIEAILDSLARVCRKADMPEYRRYERMQAMLQR